MGVFHWVLSRWIVDLRKCFCDQLLLQRTAPAFSLGSHEPFGAGRLADRSSCLVFKSACCHWVLVGILSASNTTSARCVSVSRYVRPHHGILRLRHGFVSTSLSRPVSPNVAPTLALMGAGRVRDSYAIEKNECRSATRTRAGALSAGDFHMAAKAVNRAQSQQERICSR